MKPVWRCAQVSLLVFAVVAHSFGQRGLSVSVHQPDITLDNDPVLQQLVQAVDSSRISASLLRLEAFRTRHSSTDSVVAARNWLMAQFQELGYPDITLHAFTWSGRTLHNIVVTKMGTRFPDKLLLLIGHYDSISELPSTLAPGVNDNGSGIALILEAARILSTKQLDYTVRFICFSAEEQGLIGSAAYVANVVVPQNHDIKLVINVDEIGGYRGYANTMVKVERDEDNSPPGNNQASAAYTDTLAALTRTYSNLTTSITQAYGSDYMSFEDRGYVITGFYEGQESPHYHHSTDNFANVDQAYLYQITKAALAGTAYFGGIQRRFASIHHTPLGDTQDTSRNAQVDAGIQASGQILSASIVYKTSVMPASSTLQMDFVSSHGDSLTYRGWIPKQAYGTSVSYFLRVRTLDSVVATFPQDTLVPLSFAFVPDTIPPRIVHASLSNASYLDAPFEVRASLGDTNGIAEAWLIYRNNGGIDTTVQLTQLSSDEWSGSMVGAFSPADVVEYRVGARDRSFLQNISVLPVSGWYQFRVLNSILYSFESSNGGFIGSNDWQWGTIETPDVPAPLQGQKVWGTNLAGNYSNNTASILITPLIDLSGKTDAVLAFNHFHNIEPLNDGGNVAVSIDTGAFQLISPQSGYPYSYVVALGESGYSGNSFVWKHERFALPQITNRRVQFRFSFASDLLTTQRGWYVDDVRIDYLDSATVGVKQSSNGVPAETRLFQNYPNPFNPVTTIDFEIHAPGSVNLSVFDMLGREVAQLLNAEMQPGRYTQTFVATSLSSGIYFYRLTATRFVDTKKLIILR